MTDSTRSGGPSALAHGAGLPFRLTGLNSVTSGGVASVSDTFATPRAPDALFELLRRGGDGANLHVRAHAIDATLGQSQRDRGTPAALRLILVSQTLGRAPRWWPAGQRVPHPFA